MNSLTWGDVVFVGLVGVVIILFDYIAEFPPLVNGPPEIEGNIYDCSVQLRETLNTHCVYKTIG